MIEEIEHLIISLQEITDRPPNDRHCCFCSILTTFGGKLRCLVSSQTRTGGGERSGDVGGGGGRSILKMHKM